MLDNLGASGETLDFMFEGTWNAQVRQGLLLTIRENLGFLQLERLDEQFNLGENGENSRTAHSNCWDFWCQEKSCSLLGQFEKSQQMWKLTNWVILSMFSLQFPTCLL